jgi:hypothetical protein
MRKRLIHLYALLIAGPAVILSACRRAETEVLTPVAATLPPIALAKPEPTRLPPVVTSAAATVIAPPAAIPIPAFDGPPPCGILLPAILPAVETAGQDLDVNQAARVALQAQVPAAAWPALARLLDAPSTVSLVAYQVGHEAEGIRWNAETPMPLASVAKVITLVAYVEAVADGRLNPLEPIPLSELERYYLPRSDLGAHSRAVAELRANGRLLPPEDAPAVLLQEVPWMMIRHSSNAAADYLHLRLGQEVIEQTAIALGLNHTPGGHTAPCTLLGQFLMMANHARGATNNRVALEDYVEGGTDGVAAFGRDLALLADAYRGAADFRLAEQNWRARVRQPSIDTQRYFAGRLAPQGTAGAYAALMARLAQNGLISADSSYQARLYLEWPTQFPANQALFSNVGYKNGSLPGVLTTVYYAYRWGDAAPVIVVLFYRDLPQETYRQWRTDLPHDELARWLLADPAAIPTLAAILAG